MNGLRRLVRPFGGALAAALVLTGARAAFGADAAGPPRIGDVSVVSVAAEAATISWTTDVPADGQAEYGPTDAYGSATVLESQPSLEHTVSLTGLSPGTAYHYRVKSKGASGSLAVSTDFVLTTAELQADTTPPAVVIMNPAAGAVIASTVTVSANATDNVGVASVQFLLDGSELGPPVTASPFMMAWNSASAADGVHSLGAVARDAAGNAATAVVPVNVENAPPALGPPAIAGAAPNRADVLWTTDQRADSAADYGTSVAYGSSTAVSGGQSTGHGVTLTGLVPGTVYHYRVKSRNAAGVLSVSADYSFTTPGSPALPSAGAAPADDGSAAAKAPQRFLTPASADGSSNKAVFGPDAREVSIFDVRGRRVFHGDSPSPGAPAVWDCRDGSGRVVASGLYIAKITTRDGRQVYQSLAVAK